MTAPKTWSRFTKTMNGTETKFRIQEVSAVKYEEILDLFMKYHSTEEPIGIITGVSNNAKVLQDFRDMKLQQIIQEKQQILVCCLDDDSDDLKLVGASRMALIETHSKLDYDYQIKTKEVQDFIKIVDALFAEYNVFNEYSLVNAYFADRGLVVDPAYRRMGIAEELLRAKIKVCKVNSISLYTGLATTAGSQKAAANLGAKAVRELNLEEYVKDAGLPFTCGPITVKLMVCMIPV